MSATKVIRCAGSETPQNHRIKKASINTTEWVDWEYASTAAEAVKSLKLKVKSLQVIAVELDKRSVQYDKIEYKFPVAMFVGHESDGGSEESL